MTQMLGELNDKDFKAAIIEMFHQAITNTLETDENWEGLRKEIEDIKKS